jgi:hypothetical protein
VPPRLLLLCLLLRSSWLMVEGGRQIGAAGLLYRRGGGAAVAVGQRGCWRSRAAVSDSPITSIEMAASSPKQQHGQRPSATSASTRDACSPCDGSKRRRRARPSRRFTSRGSPQQMAPIRRLALFDRGAQARHRRYRRTRACRLLWQRGLADGSRSSPARARALARRCRQYAARGASDGPGSPPRAVAVA